MGKAIRAQDARPERGSAPSDTVGLYLDEVSAHFLLTAEDEVQLARGMERGKKAKAVLDSGKYKQSERAKLMRLVAEGDDAKMTFIRSNLRLVISIAKRYNGAVSTSST